MYGPLAQWFVAADRVLYDQLAGGRPAKALDNGFIISIDPQRKPTEQILDEYGQVIEKLRESGVRRIVLANPPDVPDASELPVWTALLADQTPIFVPSRHRFADVSGNSGFVQPNPDNDGVLRRSNLWYLNGGVLSPSLPLAIAFEASATATAPRMSGSDDAVYFSSYKEIPRISVEDLLEAPPEDLLADATVFVDADLPVVSATAVIPSGQFVTLSEITAALLADIEHNRMIIAPSWAQALEVVLPALFAMIAILFMPDRERKEIAIMTIGGMFALLLIQAMFLVGLHIRVDLGRAILMFIGVGALTAFMVQDQYPVCIFFYDAAKSQFTFLDLVFPSF